MISALDLAKMSQNIKNAFKLSIITQKVNEKHGKIENIKCDRPNTAPTGMVAHQCHSILCCILTFFLFF